MRLIISDVADVNQSYNYFHKKIRPFEADLYFEIYDFKVYFQDFYLC